MLNSIGDIETDFVFIFTFPLDASGFRCSDARFLKYNLHHHSTLSYITTYPSRCIVHSCRLLSVTKNIHKQNIFSGRGSGSFTGGLLIGDVGTRDAFRYMGLLAVVGGIAYGLLHLVWLRKFDATAEEEETESAEKGEANEKDKFIESNTKDQGTSMSLERLSLMIKYNQIGSLSSLPRGSRVSFFFSCLPCLDVKLIFHYNYTSQSFPFDE